MYKQTTQLHLVQYNTTAFDTIQHNCISSNSIQLIISVKFVN